MVRCAAQRTLSVLFSEPKIPQWRSRLVLVVFDEPFSALQRAENSSIRTRPTRRTPSSRFQCSSASRKFLNATVRALDANGRICFQCSSASRKFLNRDACAEVPQQRLDFQCSSASRKFLNRQNDKQKPPDARPFSALQRAENSSITVTTPSINKEEAFQCSSASRKFLNNCFPSPASR